MYRATDVTLETREPGTYRWYVLGWSPDGSGPRSERVEYEVTAGDDETIIPGS